MNKKAFIVNRLDGYATVLEKKGDLKLAAKLDQLSDFLEKNPKVAALLDYQIKLAVNNQMGKVKPEINSDEKYMKGFGEVEAIQYDADEKAYMAGDDLHGFPHSNRSVIDRKEPDVKKSNLDIMKQVVATATAKNKK